MQVGKKCGPDHYSAGSPAKCGPDHYSAGSPVLSIFVDEEGYTTVAVALALLLSLSLCFGLANSAWMQNRSADVQVVADSCALAGADVVSSYTSIAKTLDACVLSMGVVGMVLVGLGFVASVIPALSGAAPTVLKAGDGLLQSRRSFAQNACTGLEKLESALPALIMLNSVMNVSANSLSGPRYLGCALPFPLESHSQLSSIVDDINADEAQEAADALKEASDKLEAFDVRMKEAKERGWRADCGSSPYCLYERTQTLAGLADPENPYFASVDEWSFAVPIRRARSYYQQRMQQEQPPADDLESHINSKMRAVFYRYALEQMNASYYVPKEDGSIDLDFVVLYKNANEFRQTTLFAQPLWPWSAEETGPTLHFDPSCPGIAGPLGGMASLAQLEAGDLHECLVCRMGTTDLSSVASASSSIDNGFEFYWRQIADAARDYAQAAQDMARAQSDLQEANNKAEGFFEKALQQLAVPRPKLCPPGAWGCVGVVGRFEQLSTPESLANAFLEPRGLGSGAAISGAVLAPDASTDHATLFEHFFDELAEGSSGLSVAHIIDGVSSLWGRLLVSYGSAYERVGEFGSQAFDVLEHTGPWASRLKNRLIQLVQSLGLEPADMRQLKPVLVNSHEVLSKAGYDHDEAVRSFFAALPNEATPRDVLSAFGKRIGDELSEQTITVASIPIPGTDKEIPLTISLSWLRDVL
ncbi:MAG: hypothetical protein IJ125_07710 [Atopobiaceae bacterium]|nr:hypothetical protein [Atopobiaceae bacterium]